MNKWDSLSLKEKSEMMKVAILNGITNLSDIKQKYNEFAMGGDTEEEEILNKVNNSTANFVQRLKDSNRKSIPDWETNGRMIATHKLSIGTDREGNNYIYPEVQEINGKLVDFTRPPYDWYAGMVSAEERGDTVRVSDLGKAIKFTETYKRYYPKGNTFGGGGDKKSSWKQRHQAQWYGFLRNKGISDADAQRLSGFFTAQDGLESAGGTSKAATEKNNYGGMQKGGKNIAYDSINDYMEDKWRMMNNRFKPALSARTIDEYATILGNPDTAGHGYLYYVTDKAPYNPDSAQWRAAQTQHMNNYINGMRAWAGQKTINFKNNPVIYAQFPETLTEAQGDINTPVFMPSNPQAFFAPLSTYTQPIVQEEPRQPLVEAAQTYSDEELKRQEKQDGLRKFNMLLNILDKPTSKQQEDNYFGDVLGLLANSYTSESPADKILGLMGLSNKFDGITMPTQYMSRNDKVNEEAKQDVGNYWRDFRNAALEPIRKSTPMKYGNSSIEPITGEAGNLGGITVYGKRKKPYWVSPQGAGNMSLTAADAAKAQDAMFPYFSSLIPNVFRGINDIQKGDYLGAGLEAAKAVGARYLPEIMEGTVAAGDALAATRGGQMLTSGLNFMSDAIGSSKLWPWMNAGLSSAFGAHSIDKVSKGDIHSLEDVVDTGLGLLPLAQMSKSMTNSAREIFESGIPTFTSSNLSKEKFSLIKDVLDKFANNKTIGFRAMSIADRERGYQRMKDFINSPEYQRRLEAAGLGNYKNYMLELIENRLNGNNFFPAWKADKILGKDYRGLAEIDRGSADYGITVRSDLQGDDFLNTLDHEISHWSTENTPSGFLNNIWYSFVNGKKPNFKVQNIMKFNEKIAPIRTWKEFYNSQYGGLPKKKLEKLKDEIEKTKGWFKRNNNSQERRARAYAINQEAKRKGISTDELVDKYTIEGELLGEAPKPLLELGMFYTPENLKKYLKEFLSIGTPITLGLNIASND